MGSGFAVDGRPRPVLAWVLDAYVAVEALRAEVEYVAPASSRVSSPNNEVLAFGAVQRGSGGSGRVLPGAPCQYGQMAQ